MTGSTHEPVLVNEVIDALSITADGCYLDGTFGRGGHSQAILNSLGLNGRLIAVDKDQQAVDHAQANFSQDARFQVFKSSFAKIDQVLSSAIGDGKLDGAFFDLGVSSPQLDQPERGFSFRHHGPLDMRMDRSSDESAASWLAQAEMYELRKVFRQYGEERYAGRIARQIVEVRDQAPIETTQQLAELIAQIVPSREKGKHPATRVFQAIRIRVNRELEELALMLPAILKWIKPGGRLVVISFHSLEDRIVKRFMRDEAKGDNYPVDLAVTQDMLNPSIKLVSKAIRPSSAEVAQNPPLTKCGDARSAEAGAKIMNRVVLFAGMILLASSMTLIYVRHLNRIVFVQEQAISTQRDALNIEWRKLLTELATWSVLRIENKARRELELKVPTIEQTQFVWTGETHDG